MKPPYRPDDPNLLDPEAPPSEEEVRAAESLRRALETHEPSDDADLLRSLAAANAPKPIDPSAHRSIVEAAISPSAARKPGAPRRGVVVRVAFGASAVFAAAAALVLVFQPPASSSRAELPFVARSTQALFGEPFARGATTARIDRIAAVRASEFRENRFASWGVR